MVLYLIISDCINKQIVMNSLSSLSPLSLLPYFSLATQNLIKLSPGVRRRVRARAGAGGLAVFCFSFVSLLPSRLSHSPSICTMSLARVWSCCALRCRGIRLRGSLCFLWGVGEEVEWWVMAAVGFYGFRFEVNILSLISFCGFGSWGRGKVWLLRDLSGLCLVLGVNQRGKVSDLGWLSLGSRRAVQRWVLSFAVVCFGGFHYHVGGMWAWVRRRVGARGQSVSRRLCKRFKGLLSMQLQWLFVFASRHWTFSSRFHVLMFSGGFGLRVEVYPCS